MIIWGKRNNDLAHDILIVARVHRIWAKDLTPVDIDETDLFALRRYLQVSKSS